MAITTLAFAGCQSPQQKAEKLVTKHLKETLNDRDSYESVSFSELDSLKSTWVYPDYLRSDSISIYGAIRMLNSIYKNDPIINIKSDADYHIDIIKTHFPDNDNITISLWEIFKHSQSKILEDMHSFVPEYLGWKITHKYRARNQYNALTLYHAEFHFDENLTGIINVTSAEE